MNNYAVNIRRELHKYPEVGFELPKTLALIRRELDALGVKYTEKFGKSSIVATVNPDKKDFTVGVRADIDALPITEQNEVEYKSQHEGMMHACGHDAHTAIALDVVRRTIELGDKINCRVKFIFQAAEEYPPSGAKLMAEDGVMDDIDCVIALHVDTAYEVGEIGVSVGAQNATSDGFYLDFYGKSAHAAQQERGVDAIMMAIKASLEIELMIAKEIKAKDPVIFNIGAIHGGIANNIICDHCQLFCTLRTLNEVNREYIIGRIKQIGEGVAVTAGGRFEYVESKHYPIVHNDERIVNLVRQAAIATVGEEKVLPKIQSMGGEDFSYFTRLRPGCMFRLGVYNKELGFVNGVHNDNFDIDENALQIGSDVMIRFLLSAPFSL